MNVSQPLSKQWFFIGYWIKTGRDLYLSPFYFLFVPYYTFLIYQMCYFTLNPPSSSLNQAGKLWWYYKKNPRRGRDLKYRNGYDL